RFSWLRSNGDLHHPDARLRNGNSADLPEPVPQVCGIQFECRAARGRGFEPKAHLLYREHREILAHYANHRLDGSSPPGTDRQLGHGLRGMDMNESYVRWLIDRCRMRMGGRGQGSEHSNKTKHAETKKNFGKAVALQAAHCRAFWQPRREEKLVHGGEGEHGREQSCFQRYQPPVFSSEEIARAA